MITHTYREPHPPYKFPMNLIGGGERFPRDGRPHLVIVSGQSNNVSVNYPADVKELDVLSEAQNGFRYNQAGAFAALDPGSNTDGTYGGATGRMAMEVYLSAYYWRMYRAPLYVIKYALGGYTIHDSEPQTFHPDGSPTEYDELLTYTQAAMGLLTNPYVHMVWMQGENDATNSQASADAYGTNASNPGSVGNLQYLMDSFETDLGQSLDTVVIGLLSTEFNIASGRYTPVRDAQNAYVDALSSQRKKIDNTLYSFHDDLIHIDADGLALASKNTFEKIFFN